MDLPPGMAAAIAGDALAIALVAVGVAAGARWRLRALERGFAVLWRGDGSPEGRR